jgi:hypothetical protein
MNGIPIPDIDENPWAEGPAIDPRPTDLGPLLPPLPAKPKAGMKAKVKSLLNLVKKRGPEAEGVRSRGMTEGVRTRGMTRALVEDEPPAKRRRGDRLESSSTNSAAPIASSSTNSAAPIGSSPLSSPQPLFKFGKDSPYDFSIDKGKGRASPSPKKVKRKPVPAIDDQVPLVPLSKKRKHEDGDEDGPRPFQRRVIDFDRQPEEAPADVEKQMVSVGVNTSPVQTSSIGTNTSSETTSVGTSSTQTSSIGVNTSPVQTSSIGTNTSSETTSVGTSSTRTSSIGVNTSPIQTSSIKINTSSQTSSVGTSIIDISDDETVAPGESSYIEYGEDDGKDDGEDETVAPGESSYIEYGEDEDASVNLTKLEARVDQQAEELALFRLTVNPPLGAHTLFLDFHAELRRLLQARSRTDAEATKAIEIEAVEKLRGTIDLIWWGTEVEWPGDVAKAGDAATPGDVATCCPGDGKAFLDLVAALFAYYDNDTGTSSRSNVMPLSKKITNKVYSSD